MVHCQLTLGLKFSINMKRLLSPQAQYRWMVLSRCLAGILGGTRWLLRYSFLSIALPMPTC